MGILTTKYIRPVRPLCLTALLFFCCTARSQNRQWNDTITKIPPGVLNQFKSKIFFSDDSIFRLYSALIPKNAKQEEKKPVFLDSLKVLASKNLLTKRLLNFVIVSTDTIIKKQITRTSDANYLIYSGKKIRKIELQRLEVFGANIYNPAAFSPTNIESLFNKTHINTNESIIRKNLLFSPGDQISPLTLSDNERILRQLPFIDDARIIIVPVSDEEADIIVLTKDVYSLGGTYTYKGLKKGSVALFEKNIMGIGHELDLEMPYDVNATDSPGFGAHYKIDNIWKSFINADLFYLEDIGATSYGFSLSRTYVSSTTKYAGGISVEHESTTVELGKLKVPEPFKYTLQDYWISRSFMVNKESVSRIILGGRYTNNNVFDRPEIQPDSYYNLTKYRIYLGSAAFSVQKYYKTNLIYSYGRTEDIPYGGLIRFTFGREFNEFNEFKKRTYLGTEVAVGKSNKALGYFYSSAGLATYINGNQSKQGILSLNLKYFSNLVTLGRNKIRNFIYADYTRGFDRNTDEYLVFNDENRFSGFKNDSIKGTQRLTLSLESVIFSKLNIYGFRFAFFGFTDFSLLSYSNEVLGHGNSLTGIGIGARIRNDNLVFNTFQIRLGFFPNPPDYSKINYLTVSGEQLLRPNNFDSGRPSIISYR